MWAAVGHSLLFAFRRLCALVTQGLHRSTMHAEPMHTSSHRQKCAELAAGGLLCREAAPPPGSPLCFKSKGPLCRRHALDAGETDTLLCNQSCVRFKVYGQLERCADAETQKLRMAWGFQGPRQYLSYTLRLGLRAALALCRAHPLVLLFMLLIILHTAVRVKPVLGSQRQAMRLQHIDTPHSAVTVRPVLVLVLQTMRSRHIDTLHSAVRVMPVLVLQLQKVCAHSTLTQRFATSQRVQSATAALQAICERHWESGR